MYTVRFPVPFLQDNLLSSFGALNHLVTSHGDALCEGNASNSKHSFGTPSHVDMHIGVWIMEAKQIYT